MIKTLGLTTILRQQVVTLTVEFEDSRIGVQNPTAPSVSVRDPLLNQVTHSRQQLTYDPELYGPQREGNDVFDDVLRRLAAYYEEHGQAKGFTFAAADRGLRLPPAELNVALAVQQFFDQADGLLLARAFSAPEVAVVIRHPVQTVETELDALVQDGKLQVHKGRYRRETTGTLAPVWQTGARGKVKLGVHGRLLRVMVGGPGDTAEEREAARQVIERWNINHAEAHGTALIYKHWTVSTRPQLGDRPQAIVNAQLVDNADVLVALFWNRLGLETGTEESGTVEEINVMRRAGKEVLLYFNEKDIPHANLGDENVIKEFQRLKAFRQRIEEERTGLYDSFRSTQQFASQFESHLTRLLRQLTETDFVVDGPGDATAIPNRMLRRGEVHTARTALARLHAEWRTAQNAQRSVKDRQQILRKLSHLLTQHQGQWHQSITNDVEQNMEIICAGATMVADASITYGNKNAIVEVGQGAFDEAERLLTRLNEGLG